MVPRFRFRPARDAIILICILFLLWRNSGNLDSLTDPEDRAEFIRDAFISGWEAYKKHAFPHDTLRPLTNGYYDDRNGWGCTAVDALTAAILLDVPDAVDTALTHISKIDWQQVLWPDIATFGATIRYMGAMLSAWELLTSTHSHLINDNSIPQLDNLLDQAGNLADVLASSFGSTRGINTNHINATTGEISKSDSVDITILSGLVLEWTRLSDLTGDTRYERLVLQSLEPILDPKPDFPSPFLGLFPKHLNIETGVFNTSDVGGWSHGGGGLYEMLLKLSLYDLVRFGSYRDKWILAAESTINHLASHPKGRPDLTFLADFNKTELIYQQDHSGMFAAASFILGGTVTGEKRYLDFGLDLVDTYVKMYSSSITGIGPESVGWVPSTCETGEETREEVCKAPAEKAEYMKRAGFWPIDPAYHLRPEVLESLYYAYRATGDEKYREASWQIIRNVIKWCKAGSAFAGLPDVNGKTNARNDATFDLMHSYMLTETLLYAYIIHLDDAPWQLRADGKHSWVFSTQAHPLRVRR
ncbi:alpha-1,2-mannosidase [Dendryphion nanum]|uniref:alpha-1,2-Mannosidase n=1 Tax=Dendryphion nanum TaxID=256645 RepID=A0A9P9D6F3_9PLEO|nr:alpha-1,2-mannosidase [Dendryphion nanum]